MAHLKKFSKASCGQMFSHYDRGKENFGNQDIDKTKSHLNYNLANHQQQLQGDFIKQRCSEIKVQNRKDVNVMCSWVVTAPKDLPSADEKKFFQDSYDFLKKRYGEENIISSYVHNDEKTPHLHYAFVPVVTDKKNGRHKLSAKECITRKDLQTFHQDLSNYLENSFGREIRVLNDATKSGNKSIQQLKTETALEEVKKIELHANELKDGVELLETQTYDLTDKIDTQKAELSQIEDNKIIVENDMQINIKKMGVQASELETDVLLFKTQKDAVRDSLQAMNGVLETNLLTRQSINAIQPKKTLTGKAIKDVTIEDIENLKETALKSVALKYKYNDLTLKYKILVEENSNLRKQVPTIREKMEQANEVADLKKEIQDTNSEFNRIVDVFEEYPELRKAFNNAEEDIQQRKHQQNSHQDYELDR